MDEVRYLRGPSENTLVMRKRRRSPVPAPEAQAAGADDSDPPEIEPQRTPARSAGEMSLRSEALSAVFRCCAELGSSSEASEGFSERLLSDLLKLTSADWYVLRHVSADRRQLLVAAASQSGLASGPIDLPAAGEAAQGAEASAASSRTPSRFSAGQSPDSPEPLRAVGPRASGLAYPLCFGGSLVGTISLGRRDGEFPLGQLQDEVIQTFSEFLAIQTLNLRRRNDEVRNRVVARELEIAQEIQNLLLPRILPQPTGFGLAGGWHSAREVGGDFYDAIALGGQSLLLMMVDVMGKGVPAALFATTMRGLLRGLASRSSDPAQLLSTLNRLLYKELSSVSMFITAQIVRVELQSRTVTAASAGHCPLLIIQPGRRAAIALPAQGIPIGVLPDTVYNAVTETLGTPASVLLHTDGLTDTRNPAGKPFGQRRLMAWLRTNAIPGRSAAELRDSLSAELERFRGGAAMADDQAFLLLMEEEERAAEPPANGRRRIRIQQGSFLFPGNS
jgi:serine phosphatase RsbU (regulator of sigma subunit)